MYYWQMLRIPSWDVHTMMVVKLIIWNIPANTELEMSCIPFVFRTIAVVLDTKITQGISAFANTTHTELDQCVYITHPSSNTEQCIQRWILHAGVLSLYDILASHPVPRFISTCTCAGHMYSG